MSSPATIFKCSPQCWINQGVAPSFAIPRHLVHPEPEPPAEPESGTIAHMLDMLSMLPCVKELVADLESRHRHVGRKGYHPMFMLRCFFAKYLKGERNTARFIRDLKQNPALRRVCGFGGRVPHPSAFSRFYARLAEDPDRLELIQQAVVAELRKYLPDLGLDIGIDGTDVVGYVSARKEPYSDPDATKGRRTPKGGGVITGGNSARLDEKDKKRGKRDEFFVGFKDHVIADLTYGIPLSHTVLPANESESTELPRLLNKTLLMHDWIRPNHLVGDAGYAGEPNALACVQRGIIPVIAGKSAPETGPTKHPGRYRGGLYDSNGNPTCPDSKNSPMEWVRTVHEDGEIFHEYRCPPQGCELRARSSGAMIYCNPKDVHRERAGNEHAGFDLAPPIAREDPKFKELMARRTEIERVFGLQKSTRSLDWLTYRGLPKTRVHANLSTATHLITMLSHAKAGDISRLRVMTIEELE